MNYETEAAAIKRVILDHERFAAMQYVSRHAMVDIVPEMFGDMLAMRLETELLVDRIAEDTYEGETVTMLPSSPWQFFKQRHGDHWWLRWLVQRRPVRQESHRANYSVTWTKRALYPDARIEMPEKLGKFTIYETVEGRQIR